MRRFDLNLIKKWLADNKVEAPIEITPKDVDNFTRYVLTEMQAGRVSIDDALEALDGQ